jgi:hypothetical protein
MIMMNGFKQPGVPAAKPVESLPQGVIALAGWANRFLIIVYCLWTITIARILMRLDKR